MADATRWQLEKGRKTTSESDSVPTAVREQVLVICSRSFIRTKTVKEKVLQEKY